MNDPLNSPSDALTRIDQVCDEFELAWRRGEALSIEDQLTKVDAASKPALLRELLLVEWEILRHRNQPIELHGYIARFPSERTMIRELRRSFRTGARRAEVPREGSQSPIPITSRTAR